LTTLGVHDQEMGNGPEVADTESLGTAYADYGGELLRYARRSLRDPQLAEEAVQETFVRAWRSRATFDHQIAPLRAWLFAIERRVVIDLATRRAGRPTDPIDEDLASPGDEIDVALVGFQVEEALRRLKSEHRDVLVRTYFGRCTGRELAQELGIPEGTVRSRLYYALRALRLTLDEMGWEW
jgi:RNA polymerase sigma-70 factor (ECF subfamily)